MKEKKRRT